MQPNKPTPAPETAEYLRGAIAALEEIYNGPNVLRSAARVTIVAMLESYRLKLRALTPPAIAPGDVAIAPEAEVAGPTWELLDACEKALLAALGSSASYDDFMNSIQSPEDRKRWVAMADAALALIAQAKEAGR